MKKPLTPLLVTLLLMSFSVTADSVISVKSGYSVAATTKRLEKTLEEKGFTVFSVINHQQNAANVELDLAPTQVVIFGNPKVGTLLMQCSKTVAIDLPQKALVWEDENGNVWLSYNDPRYLQHRHKIEGCNEVVAKISNVLANLSQAVTAD